MTIINTSPDRIIQLGYEGEDRVTVLRFRYGADWLENGEGIFNIRVRRHGEHTAYNAALVADDSENHCLLMTVTNVELSVKGSGEMQVVYSGENFVKKSPIYSYNVSRAVDEVADPPAQDVYTQIIESLSDLQTDVQGLSDAVEDIGDISLLTTTAKTDLVSAINEVNEHGGSSVTVDDALSTTSTNPVQNKAITGALAGKADKSLVDVLADDVADVKTDTGALKTAIQGKADTQTVSALADEVNGLDEDVQGLQTTVQSKADTTTVTALSGTVSGLQTAVQSKADAQTVTTLSGTVTGLQTTKADKSYVDTQLSEKASTQTVSDLADDVSDLQTSLAGKVDDVQINGTSVVTDGVANLPRASNGILGVVRVESGATYTGIGANLGLLYIVKASDANIKSEENDNKPIVPSNQHTATFYGLAKVAGHDEKNSTLPVGQYTDEAKVAIQKMLGVYEAPWELINEETFTNETEADYVITTDSNGNAFELTDIRIVFWLPEQNNVASKGDYGRISFFDNSSLAYNYAYIGAWTQQANSASKGGWAELLQDKGMLSLYYTTNAADSNNTNTIKSVYRRQNQWNQFIFVPDTKYCSKIAITKVTGTGHYRLYGKRRWQ